MQYMSFYVSGMHCTSCEMLLEKSLIKLDTVEYVEASLRDAKVTIGYEHTKLNTQHIKKIITDCGYVLRDKPISRPLVSKNLHDWMVVGVSLVVFFLLYTIAGHMGFTGFDFQPEGGLSLSVIILLGLTAGFSTCMALIGGLIMGVSAARSKKNEHLSFGQKMIPHLRFHGGRIGGFVVLGAILGLLGSFFKISPMLYTILTILVAIVLLVLGLNLTGLFPRLQKIAIAFGDGVSGKTASASSQQMKAMLAGAGTFFLPCGFTLAAQLFALGTGSPWIAGAAMGLFALGTLPGLLGVGALTSFFKGQTGKYIYQTLGVLLVLFSVRNFSNAWGTIAAKFTTTASPGTAIITDRTDATPIALTFDGKISPSETRVQQGKKYTLTLDVKKDGRGCMTTMWLPGLDENVQEVKAGTPIVFHFVATKPGEYEFVCASMNMRHGGKVVVE